LSNLAKIFRSPQLIPTFLRAKFQGLFTGTTYAYRPQVIYIGVNQVCNARCVMCDVGLKNKGSSFYANVVGEGHTEMPVELFEDLVGQVKGFRPLICVNVTEPLIYRPIARLVEVAARAGVRMSITTNGIALAARAEELVEAGLHELIVSLDGLAEAHDAIRGQGVFEKAMRGLEALAESKRRKGAARPAVRLNATISNLNYTGLYDFAAFCLSKLEVEGINFSHVNYVPPQAAREHNQRFGWLAKATPTVLGTIAPEKVNVDVLFGELSRLAGLGPRVSFMPVMKTLEEVRTYYTDYGVPVGRKKCLVPWFMATVKANGDLIIADRCFSYRIGSLHDDDFLALWNGERYRRFRKALLEHGLFPACHRCCGIQT
jgi:MoaA/NifB/PqqE/SkfB family radical SAM enzyme